LREWREGWRLEGKREEEMEKGKETERDE